MNELIQFGEVQQTMSSLDIAEATGKQHKHVMEAIRKMEPAWEKVHGSKFRLMSREIEIGNGAIRTVPCYELTKTECLFIATKFKDEARAKLVLRWEDLETGQAQPMMQQPKSGAEMLLLYAQQMVEQEKKLNAIQNQQIALENRITSIELEREENHQLLISAELSEKNLPEESENSKIRNLVNTYVKATGVDYRTAWESIYETLERRYKKRIKAYAKLKEDKSFLDVAIRNGLGEYLYIIISNMIKNTNKI